MVTCVSDVESGYLIQAQELTNDAVRKADFDAQIEMADLLAVSSAPS